MTKEQYIEQYLDEYERKHPDERIDYEKLREQADCEWYDKQVDAGKKTEYDLTKEQEKEAKKARQYAKSDKERKKAVRERKPDEDKREIVEIIAENLKRVCTEDMEMAHEIQVVNPEREVSFVLRGVEYSVQVIKHRPPKAQK